MAIPYAKLIDAVPNVANAADRSARFPSPDTYQKIYRIDTGDIEQWDGSSWVVIFDGSITDYIYTGTGSPEDVVTAAVGSIYLQTDGTFGRAFWVKAVGAGNTGWMSAPIGDQRANAQRLLGLFTRGVEDATFLLISDSTGTSTYWSPTFFNALAALFPAYTVTLRYWNNTTFVYGAPTTIQTGTGSQTLDIYNCSISGANTATFLDQYFEDRIAEVLPDYVMISLGHNENPTASLWQQQYLEILVSVQQACPQASLCIVAQNPASANQNQELRAAVYSELAQLYGCGFIDICQIFNENGGAAALTTDGIHPNAAGSALWAAETLKAFRYTDTGLVTQGSAPWLDVQELLTNGDFSRFAGSVPDGWVAVGSPTVTKDLVNFESPNDYSVNIQAAGGVAGYLQQTVPAERLRGRWVTLIARVYKATDIPTSSGRIGIYDGSGSIAATQSRISFVFGAFRWIVAQRYIDPAATNVTVFMYGDTTTTNGGASFDRCSMVLGKVPRLGVYGEAIPASQVQAGTFGLGSYAFGANTGPSLNVDLNGAAGTARSLRWLTAGVGRWVAQTTLTAESGSNAGSNFSLIAFTDAGATIDVPISITRAAGGAIVVSRRLRTPYGVTFPESADRGDANQTLTFGTDDPTQWWGTTLTANRTISLSSTGAVDGDTWYIRRTAGGAFTLSVGGLILLYPNQWCTVRYNGSAFVVVEHGSLTNLGQNPSVSADNGDTSPTFTVGLSSPTQRFDTTLTANRTATLSATNAVSGSRFRVERSAGGAFTLTVGGLIVLRPNEWADFEYTGAAWQVTAAGSLEIGHQVVDGWYQDNVTASQTDVELTRGAGRFVPVRAGSVTGIVVKSTEARTAGTLTVEVFKNTGLAGAAGSQLGTLSAVLDGTNTSVKSTTQARGTDVFAAGDELYCVVTTDGSWLPTTADIRVSLEVTPE